MSNYLDERQVRLQKLQEIKKSGLHPYPEKFDKKHSLQECFQAPEKTKVQTAGRVMLIREMGKLTFAHLQDNTRSMQIAFTENDLGAGLFTFINDYIDRGDFLGIEGEIFVTHKGEKSILVKSYTFLGKGLRPLPEKFHGVQDREIKYRQRYLDLLMDQKTRERFLFRSKFLKLLRDFYEQEGFIEVETGVLGTTASGALAKPFVTHHNALDIDIYLRIALETTQKKLIVGGFEKTFEMGPVFRNEGIDPSHLQEFTMLEHYAAYWNYEDNMRFTERMFAYFLEKLTGTLKISIPDRNGVMMEVNFTSPWDMVSFRDLLFRDAGIDINNVTKVEDLRKEIREKNIEIEDIDVLGYGNLVDALYKKVSRPYIVGPTFLVGHPLDLSPLARKNDENPDIVDRFQLIVNGWEIVNAYSELVDPVDQKQRFEDQSKLKTKGDADAHDTDDEYIKAMEYGMPPISGWGMGIDRILTLLTSQENLRDVILFPLMRPAQESKGSEEEKAETSNTIQTPIAEQQVSQEKAEAIPENIILENSSENSGIITAGCSKEDVLELIDQVIGEQTKKHLLAVGAAMKHLSHVYHDEQNENAWEIAGLAHDIDWDLVRESTPEQHGGDKYVELLRSIHIDEKFIKMLQSHIDWLHIPRPTLLQKALFAVDELCGMITAAALIRPSKSLDDLEAKSVLKKMKDASFAAKIDRSWILSCETELNTPIEQFIRHTIDGMKSVQGLIGLTPLQSI